MHTPRSRNVLRKLKLGFTLECMSDEFPVDEVATVIYRHSREIVKATGHEVVVLTDTAYARIRIHAFDNRIGVTLSKDSA